LSYLMLTSEASSTEVKPPRLTFYHNSDRVDIGHKIAVGMTFGVADIVAKLGCLTAQITLSRQYSTPLTSK